jgi:hypothetical protein
MLFYDKEYFDSDKLSTTEISNESIVISEKSRRNL